MIKMEYRRIDKSTIHAHAEMYGKFYDIVDEIAAFLEDVHDKDPKLCVCAIDRFLDNIGIELEGGEADD